MLLFREVYETSSVDALCFDALDLWVQVHSGDRGEQLVVAQVTSGEPRSEDIKAMGNKVLSDNLNKTSTALNNGYSPEKLGED